MRGYQLVIHGYLWSCLVFFYIQYKTKNLMEKGVEDMTAIKTFAISLFGAALAELSSVPFYYPYDLVKVRMQTMQAKYGYRNFIDGCAKIWCEKHKQPSFTFLIGLAKMRNFYSGAGYYTLAYTALISLEFAIHDMLIEYIDEFTGSSERSILHFLQIIPSQKVTYIKEEKTGHNHWHNELISSFAAGAIGAFFTNGLEIVAVNK